MIGGGFGDCRFSSGGVGDVALNGNAVDIDCHFGGGFGVDVEDRDLGAGLGQHPRRRGSEAGASTRDEGRVSTNIHDQLACA